MITRHLTARRLLHLDEQLTETLAGFARRRLGDGWLMLAQDAFDLTLPDTEQRMQLGLPWVLYHTRIEGDTICERFLDEEGRQVSDSERAWLEAQTRTDLGVWEVVRTRRGEGVELVDLRSGHERFCHDRSASESAHAGEALLARVIDHHGISVIGGLHPASLDGNDAASLLFAVELELAQRRARTRRRPRPEDARRRRERADLLLIRAWEALTAD